MNPGAFWDVSGSFYYKNIRANGVEQKGKNHGTGCLKIIKLTVISTPIQKHRQKSQSSISAIGFICFESK